MYNMLKEQTEVIKELNQMYQVNKEEKKEEKKEESRLLGLQSVLDFKPLDFNPFTGKF